MGQRSNARNRQRAKAKKQEHNPPKVKPKVITYPKVNIVTVSPRDPQIPNPVDTYIATKKWMPKQEIQKYFHLHPDIYDQDSVQTAMDRRFPDGLPVVDLCPSRQTLQNTSRSHQSLEKCLKLGEIIWKKTLDKAMRKWQ